MNPNCPVCTVMMTAMQEEPEKVTSTFVCEYCGATFFPAEQRSDPNAAEPVTIDGVIPAGGNIAACCPICPEQPLAKAKLDEYPALYCEECAGVLISNQNFSEVLHRRRRNKGRVDTDPDPINPEELNRKIHCPNCMRRMDVHPYFGPGNVVIDSCCNCFLIWFDHGEIATIEKA